MERNAVRVSVVIPLFNKAPWIERAVRSVFNQSHGADVEICEVIVVDDGSTDGGGDLLETLAFPKVTVHRQGNFGVSAARNKGMGLASGHWVALLDADDEWRQGYVRQCAAALERYPTAGLIFSHFERKCGEVKTNTELSREPFLLDDYFEYAWHHGGICSSAVWIRREALPVTELFPVGVRRGEDLTAWHRLIFSGIACAVVPSPLVFIHVDSRDSYRQSMAASGASIDWTFMEDYRRILRSASMPTHLRVTSLRYMNRLVLRSCLELARQGNRVLAVEALLKYYRGGPVCRDFGRLVLTIALPVSVHRAVSTAWRRIADLVPRRSGPL